MAEALADGRFSVMSFVPARVQVLDQIDERLARLAPRIAASAGPRHRLHHRIMRFVVKAAMVVWTKPHWDFVAASFRPKPFTVARELDRFLERAPFARVHLITHSAGGISATKIAANPKIASICCFGYPFMHPRSGPESYRTRHLASTTKPLLIVQGRSDEYAPAPTDLNAMLPAHAAVIAVDCDHDYAEIPDTQFEAVLRALRALVAEPAGEPMLQPTHSA
ncbi:alpha/beta family hydrolase [Novosphingobium huizhouense]|uniref:alpha/beta family hydrolase n=1 Tax=Novosphingobium huizhouense TaxID=2866625 RepID=UPI001CD8C90F|nr:alpha/beta family hydrolase [Novosphingobium huizhouense]